MNIYGSQKKEELLEACRDLRLPVSGNEAVETLELYIQAAYDDFENKNADSENPEELKEEIDYGSIGDKSWRLRYILNKILFFI